MTRCSRPKGAGHARHRRPHRPYCRPHAAGRRRRAHPDRRARRPGRAQRHRQDHAVRRHRRRHRARARQRGDVAALAHRTAGAGSAGRTGQAASTSCSRPTASAAALLAEAETAQDPHRIAEIQTRLADIGAHAAPARAASILAGLGFPSADQQRACAEFSGGWRMRVALAAVLFAAARSAAARRADQLSRPRRHALAAGASCPLSAHLDRHQPRPRSARQRGRPHPLARTAEAHALPRRLFGVRAPAQRAAGAGPEDDQEAGRAAQAFAGLRRPLPRQGHQGAAGAVAPEDAGQARADRRAGERRSAADCHSGAAEAAVAADHRDRRRRRRL